MGMALREVGALLTGCILMVLAASSSIWYYAGVAMLRRVTRIDEYYIHLIKTLLPVGTVAGTIIFSLSAELVGRKITLLAISIPYAVAFTIFQFARSIPVVCLGQVIAGLSVGGSFVVLPIYIGELAAPSSRGFFGTLMSAFFYMGILLYRALGAYSTYTLVNLTSIGLAVIFFVIFLIFGLESPFYYIKKHKGIKELEEIDKSTDNDLTYTKGTKFMRCYGSTAWIKSVTMILVLIIINHLSGVYMIPILIHYTYTYFQYKDIMLSYESIHIYSFVLQLLGTIICIPLIDRYGRKICLTISTLGIAIFVTPVAIFAAVRSYWTDIAPFPSLTIIFVIAFLIFYNIGIYPVPQILLGELFPYQWKTVIVAVLVSIQQVTSFMLNTYYPEISWIIGDTLIIFIYMISMFAATCLIYFLMLETKQKSLQEIQLALKNN